MPADPPAAGEPNMHTIALRLGLVAAVSVASIWAGEGGALALGGSGQPLVVLLVALCVAVCACIFDAIGRRWRLALTDSLGVVGVVAGAFWGAHSLHVAYNEACPASESARAAVLRYRSEHGVLPPSLEHIPGLKVGTRTMHPPVLSWRRTGDDAFEIWCTDGFVYWHGSEGEPMVATK